MMSDFMTDLLTGDALVTDFDDYVSSWHSLPDDAPHAQLDLHVFLGMTWDEYRLFLEHPESIRFITAAHRANKSYEDILKEDALTGVAARANNEDDARRLLDWLVERGRVTHS